MWDKVVGWLRFLWDAGEKTKENSDAIKELRQGELETYEAMRTLAAQNVALAAQNEMLRQELQHEREKRADEFEKLELRLRLQIAEELRRLPPGPNS